MPRLVAFGCSYTYGHGLSDCCDQDLRPGPHPSKYAWPQLLADKLGYECVNLSAPGSGNFQILITLLKSNLLPDDLVILAFTYFMRYDFYTIIDKEGNGVITRPNDPSNKNKILLQAQDEYWEEKSRWENWLAIQHCELYLKYKQIKNYSFINLAQDAVLPKPNPISLDNLWDDIRIIYRDIGLDNKHPGPLSHTLQAEKIYNKIRFG